MAEIEIARNFGRILITEVIPIGVGLYFGIKYLKNKKKTSQNRRRTK